MDTSEVALEFVEYPKIPRYSREVIVTEKLDGTNAQIWIGDNDAILAGSRTRWLTPDSDNHGFGRWVFEHKEELLQLGPGRHFGEWWGSGIQRGYGFKKGEKFFSLFNVVRWCLNWEIPKTIPTGDPRLVKFQTPLPACVGLVPVLWRGLFDNLDVNKILADLEYSGSIAAPGFMRPEGVVVFHTAGNVLFKKTLGGDGAKGEKK